MHRIANVVVLIVVMTSCDQPPAKHSAAATTRHPPVAVRPTVPPTLGTTTDAWSRAENSKNPADWDEAAAAYERELESCAEDCRELAYAIVLARQNALSADPIEPPPGDEPVPMPPRVQAMVAALDRYVALADPSDPDLAGMKFLAGSALRRWHQPDAIARLEAVLREHRGDPTAEYSANLILDALNRSGRTDEMKQLVQELLADSAFLIGKDELRETLERIRERAGIE